MGAGLSQVPTPTKLRKELIKTKEVLENKLENEKLNKETYDPIEQAASFLNMDPDNLKQIGDLLKGFGVNFVLEKNNENSEESREQVGSSTEKEFVMNEKEGKETNGNGTFIENENQQKKINRIRIMQQWLNGSWVKEWRRAWK